MKKKLSIISRSLLPSLAVALLVHVSAVSAEKPSGNNLIHPMALPPMWVDGHYGYWWHYGMPPWRLPWSTMTHVVHFGGIYPSGKYPYFSIAQEWDVGLDGIHYQDSLIAIAHRNNVKVLMELGDNLGRGYDSISVQGDTAIQSWVHNVSAYMLSKGYDGADVDLEPQPGPPQQSSWGKILHYLRDTLYTWNPRGIVTVDVMQYYSIYWNPDTLAAAVDHINLMEYDQGGSWSSSTTFNSPLYAPRYPGYNGGDDSSGAMSWIANNGSIPASKIGLGVPLYGRMFSGVAYPNLTPNNNYQNRFYNEIVNKDQTSATAAVYWQDSAKVPYVSDPGQNHFVTYDDTLSLRLKAEFAIRHGLGGVMMFGVGEGYLFDPPLGRDPNELSNTVAATLGRTISPPAGDTVRPSITLISQANGDTVSGAATLVAQASDDVGIARVDFLLNGYVLAKAIRPPYTAVWNSSGVRGAQSIVARAFDIAGNYSTTPPITVIVVAPALPPPTPALASPPDSAAAQLTRLTLTWNPSNTATSYRLQVSADSLFSTNIHDDSTITTASRQVGPLAGTTTYFWHVNAKNSGGTSAFSQSRSFTTTVAPPAQPTLLSPGSGLTGQPATLTLSWNPAAGAASYRVQVAGDSLFSTIVLDDSTVAATSRQAGALANNTRYFWRVGAINIGGKSAYSSTWNFRTVLPLPGVPALQSPGNGATCRSTPLTLSWNPSSDAATYRLQLSFDSLFSSIVYDSTGASTSRKLASLNGSLTYYWRVNALNAGGASAFTNTRSFATFPFGALRDDFNIPDRPLPGFNKWVGIQNQPNGGTMLISSGAIKPYSNAGNFDFGGVAWDSLVTGGAEASLTLVQKSASYFYTSLFIYGRMNNKDYNTGTGYRLRYLEQSGKDIIEIHRVGPGYSNSSLIAQTLFEVNPGDVITFRVLCDNQTMAAMVNNVQILSVRDTIYQPAQWYFAIRGSIFPAPVIYDNFRISPTPTGPPSPPSVPALFSPANGSINQPTALGLNWNAAARAASYGVQVSTDSSFGTRVLDDSTVPGTTKQIGPLSIGTAYYWRANARNVSGVSPWSAVWKFTTLIPLPAAPALLSPLNNSTGQATTLTSGWNSSPGAVSYRFQLATDSAFVNKTVDDSTLTDTARVVSNLANGTAYYWRVRAKNGGGPGAYSPIWKFTTIIAVPPTPSLASPANGTTGRQTTLVLAWNPAPGAASYRIQVGSDSLLGSIVLEDSTVTAPARPVGPLSGNTIYYWRVCAKNSAGTSAFSSIWNFMTSIPPPPAPLLLSPQNAATGQATSPAFGWNSSPGATVYRCQLATDSGFVNKAVDDSTVADTARAVTNLANNTLYYWRISASNAGGSGAYSAVWKFSTIVALPSVPALAAPANGAACQSTALTLSWTAVTNGVQYRVQVALDTSFSTRILDDSAVTTLSRQITSLAGGTRYFWRVASSNAAGSSLFPAAWSFSTLPLALLRDDFNRTNGPLPGSNRWALIQNQPTGGSLVIAANAVQPTSSAGNLNFGGGVWDSLVTGGAEASVTVVQKSGNLSYTSLFIYARMNNKDYNTGTGYRLRFQQQSPTDRLEIHKVGPGYANSITLASIGFKINPGDVITLRTSCDNRKLTGLVNGVQVISATDSAYMPAQWYFAIRGCVFPTPVRYDNFMVSPQLSATSGAGLGIGGEDTNAAVSVTPKEFALGQNYPNPFNPTSTISFVLPKQTQVRLEVFNVLGQLIATLLDEERAPGRYSVTWEAGNKPAGVYFYRLLAGDYARSKKMILAK